jgi:Inner membrane protein YgaP-like, transmembrane domain
MSMNMDRKIRLIAGTFILVSVALAVWVSLWWLVLTAFVGVNLIQSAFTRWCLMEDILRGTGLHKEG